MQVYSKPLFASLPLTMNTTLTSQAMQLWDIFGYSIQVVFTGTPTGSFKLQGSCDPIIKGNPAGQTPQTPAHWSDIENSTQSITAAGDFVYNVADSEYNYVRLIYTDTSGGTSTASLTSAIFNGKGI